MCRWIVGTFVLLAACGGAIPTESGIRKADQLRADPGVAAILARESALFGQDVVDACFDVWVQNTDPQLDQVYKPKLGLERAICLCAGGSNCQ